MALQLAQEPIAPGVVYTHAPSVPADQMAPPSPLSKSARAKQRHADAALRRAAGMAWKDPKLSTGESKKAAPVFAALRDPQGLAGAFVAHAEARCAHAHHAHHAGVQCSQNFSKARDEYAQAVALYRMLASSPELYDWPRQKRFHEAMAEMNRTKHLLSSHDASVSIHLW